MNPSATQYTLLEEAPRLVKYGIAKGWIKLCPPIPREIRPPKFKTRPVVPDAVVKTVEPDSNL